VLEQPGARVRARERSGLGAGDDRQPVAPGQRRDDGGDAGDHDVGAADQLEIAPIARGAQRIDVGGPEAALARQVPGAPPFTQEQLDVGGGVELDPHARQGLLVRAKVEVFGVDEDAVVVEQDGVEHAPRYGSSRSFRNRRMSPIRSMR
jgi:hypothetical protein